MLLNMIGFRDAGITVDSKVSKLSGGERQGVSIGRAMHFDADLIILDEPTVALSLKEVRKVLNFVHKIKENGKASVYISHNLNDVYEISLKDLNTFLLDYAYGLMEDHNDDE